MSFQELSFAPDRRSVQTTFYHFSERSSGESEKRGFSQQDSLIWALNKIYQSKFANISEQFRNILVEILVANVPLAHHNLTMLAAANFIIYHMRSNGLSLNIDSNVYTSPCDPPQAPCVSTNPGVISCKQTVNAQVDQRSKNTFDAYFNYVAPFIMSDVSGKKPEEIAMIRAQHKITLLRYLIFVQDNITPIATSIPGQST